MTWVLVFPIAFKYRMSGNNILSEEEKKRLMRELVNHYARDLEEEDLEENLAREISTVKNNQIPRN